MKKIYIYAEACGKRQLDANRIKNYFLLNKFKIVDKPNFSDFIIFVTCGFNNKITDNAFKKINYFQQFNAELIVAGCVPETDKEKLYEHFKGKTISTKNIDKIDDFFPENKIKFHEVSDTNIFYNNPSNENLSFFSIMQNSSIFLGKIKNHIIKNLFDYRSFIYQFLTNQPFFNLRISGGCLGNCSYCAIKKAVGVLKSKPVDQCLEEFKKGLDEGYITFVIVADDVGAYGLDIKTNFVNLLDKLTDFPGDYNIFIRDLHPKWFVRYSNELSRILMRNKIKSIDVPIQSGSQRVLKLMNRYSDTQKILDTFLMIRKKHPSLFLNTHILVGFPTESDEDFNETINMVKKVGFNSGFIYPFSCKDRTEAEKIQPRLTDEIIKNRVNFLVKVLKKQNYLIINISRSNFLIFNKK